jgi:hypothetical protein
MFPFKFPMGSHQVLNVFLKGGFFPIAPCFHPIYFLPKVLPFSPILIGPKGESRDLSIESSILGSLHSFNYFFVMGQSNWLIAAKKKKRSWTSEATPN